jgi:hypothetical protein
MKPGIGVGEIVRRAEDRGLPRVWVQIMIGAALLALIATQGGGGHRTLALDGGGPGLGHPGGTRLAAGGAASRAALALAAGPPRDVARRKS